MPMVADKRGQPVEFTVFFRPVARDPTGALNCGPKTSVNAARPGRIYPEKAPRRENSCLITGWKGCYRQKS